MWDQRKVLRRRSLEMNTKNHRVVVMAMSYTFNWHIKDILKVSSWAGFFPETNALLFCLVFGLEEGIDNYSIVLDDGLNLAKGLIKGLP